MEKLQTLHDDFNLHKKLKETIEIYRKRTFFVIVDENIYKIANKMANNIQEKKKIWEEYARSLLQMKSQTYK